MAETSPGWNVDYEIIPGTRFVKGVMASVKKHIAFLPPSEGYPSERRHIPEPQVDPVPGEIGSVAVLDYRAAANDIIN